MIKNTSQLHKSLSSRCQTDSKGLFLVDLPTGYGKTHSMLDFIVEQYQNSERKIIFLTNLKKNLPFENLRKRFEEIGKLEDFERDAIEVKPNYENVENFLEGVKLPEIVANYSGTEELKRALADVKKYKELYENQKIEVFKDLIKNKTKEIRERLEPIFRDRVRLWLKDHFSNPKLKQRVRELDRNKSADWVKKIYPSVLTRQKRILFMSVDKFLLRNDPLIEAPHFFFDPNFLKNAIIIIDEFDAAKAVFLRRIIGEQIRQRIDIPSLFLAMYSSFKRKVFPSELIQDSEENLKKIQENPKKFFSAEKMLDELRTRIEYTAENINADYSLKARGLKLATRNFLFHDYKYHTIIGEKYKKSFFYTDHDAATHSWIATQKEELISQYQQKLSLFSYLGAISRDITFFENRTERIAKNYHDYMKEKPVTEGGAAYVMQSEFLWHNALKTFLNEFTLDDTMKSYLLERVEQRKINRRLRKYENNESQEIRNRNSYNFYENGFRYYEFEDNETHNTRTKVIQTVFDITPERFLLDLALSNHVIGVSATASLATVIGNFDIDWLKRQLGTSFQTLSKDEKKAFQEVWNDRFKAYESGDIQVLTRFIEVNEKQDFLKQLSLVLQDEEGANEILSKIEDSIQEDDESDFFKNRYLKIAKAYDYFLENDDIRSFVAFLNTHPTEDNKRLNLSVLKSIFKLLVEKRAKQTCFTNTGSKSFDIEKTYKILSADEFDKHAKDLLKRLSSGEKIFVMTTYRTLGVGQNIQYEFDVEDGDPSVFENTIKAFKRDNGKKEKDFDGIYLDKPTNIVVNNPDNDANFSLKLFQLENLARKESNPELSVRDLETYIRETFNNYYNKQRLLEKRPQNLTKLSETTDVMNALCRDVIQAVGRLGRTNYKNKQIHLLADSELRLPLASFNTNNMILLKEFEALIEMARQKSFMVSESDADISPQLFNEISFVNDYCNRWITNHLYFNGEKDVQDWQLLREQVLKYPTLSASDRQNSIWAFAYIPTKGANNYFYFQEGDFDRVGVNMKRTAKHNMEVSDNAARLDLLMKNGDIKKWFEQQGYATTFSMNDYVIAPQIFNAIYKGALGEIVGQWVLEKLVGVCLEELPFTVFEKFDFRLPNGIYIDFKHWDDEKNNAPEEEQLKKINNKIQFIEKAGEPFEKVFIINVIADTVHLTEHSKDKRLIKIPALIDNSNGSIMLNRIEELRKYLL